jgi:hypothetical protein
MLFRVSSSLYFYVVVLWQACFGNEPIRVVLGVLESDQSIDFLVQVSIARCELIAEHAQDPEVDLVGSVGIGRVPFRFDIRGVVEQDVEHVMAFVLVRADDLGVDRHMIENQRVGAHALLQTEVFAGVSGVDRRDLRL